MENNHFIKSRIKDDLESGRVNNVVLRFPPEPNGYLHLGHAKSIVLNSTLAEEFGGTLNLRFDDTNPTKESEEYVEAIKRDAAWLSGVFNNVLWASDYFDTLYACAVLLIRKGLAYVDDSTPEMLRELRGSFDRPGRASEFRSRSVEDNLALFARMRAGEFEEGSRVLRAKIDMAHPNLNMRDPVLYRVSFAEHHNTGKTWCIYPMYDFAHPVSDALEGITHSLCTLEFEDHRPLYDWVIGNCRELLGCKPEQIEFARLEVEGVVLSKRKLNALVTRGDVSGWDSPEMPTIAGLRNRGYTADILRRFILRCGFAKANSTVERGILDECVRDALNPEVDRKVAVLDPVLLVIENLNETLTVEAPNHPKDTSRGARTRALGRELWIERDDVRIAAEEGFWRVYPGNWIRLRHGYNLFIKAVEHREGQVTKVIAEMDWGSKNPKEAKHKAKTALHWLAVSEAVPATVHRYGNLCDEEGAYNPASCSKMAVLVEPGLAPDTRYEFERNGYFYSDRDGILHCLADLKR